MFITTVLLLQVTDDLTHEEIWKGLALLLRYRVILSMNIYQVLTTQNKQR